MGTDAEDLLREAEEEIEQWYCALDRASERIMAETQAAADHVRASAQADAAEIVAVARVEAELIIADAHATAGEHADVIRALDAAEREAVGEELESLRDAVRRLRTELSRLVDAAFDALPAVEATADAIERALADQDGEPEPAVVGADDDDAPAKRRGLRRLFHRG
jgi:hypothetical protein